MSLYESREVKMADVPMDAVPAILDELLEALNLRVMQYPSWDGGPEYRVEKRE